MIRLSQLAARIDYARAYFQPRERRDLVESIHELTAAAAAAKAPLTLNVAQTAALQVYLDSVLALRETRVIELAAVASEAPGKVIPFPRAASN